MKKYIFPLVAIVSLFSVSCSKELPAEKENGNGNQTDQLQCVINASVEDISKLALSGLNFTWDAGDKLLVRLANTASTVFPGDVYGCEKFTASTSGASTVFTGKFEHYDISAATAPENTYCYYATDGRWLTSTSPFYYKTVPTTQTGLLADIKDNILLYGACGKGNITLVKDADEVPVGYSFDIKLHPFFTVLKINVPASLNLTELKLSSESAIAGTFGIKPMGRTYGTMQPDVTDGFLDRGHSVTSNEYEITVSRGGETISGDVYIVVIPDAFDSEAKEYYCDTDKLTFTLTDANGGTTTFTNYLNGKIYCKTLKDLGTMPETFKASIDAGALCLLDDTTLKVGVENASASCTYYYETATSKSALAIPTTSSAQFDPAEGFAISSANSYDAVYVNVLAKSNDASYSSRYLTGVVRNWNFKSGTPVAEALTDAFSSSPTILLQYGSGNVNNGSTYTTSDGITLFRQTANADAANLTVTSDYIKYRTHRVWPFVTVSSNSDVWYYVKTANDLSYGANILYNTWGNSATKDVNGNDCKIAVTKGTTVEQMAYSFHLGNKSSGDRIGFRGDAGNGNIMYNIALLEIGEDVGVTSNAAPTSVKFRSDIPNPTLALDSDALAGAQSAGTRYY